MNIEKGYVGLENLGNTCFMNSCLQIIKEIPQLTSIIKDKFKNNMLNDNTDSILSIEWYNLTNLMNENNGVIRPNRFLEVLQKYAKIKNKILFTGYSQNDIQEFYILIIDAIHNSIFTQKNIVINGNVKNEIDSIAVKCYEMLAEHYKKEYSESDELFQGICINIIQGVESKTTNIKPEIFADIALPVSFNNQSAKNIYDCFDIYLKHDYLNDDNKWFNEKIDKKENAIKYIKYWSFPNILFILFKRFSYNGRSKINTVIDFPVDELDLSKYVCGYQPNSYKYELFGICNHSGRLEGGHYTAFVKNKYNKWLHYNDSIIEEVKDKNKLITAKAYCLFYRKKNN